MMPQLSVNSRVTKDVNQVIDRTVEGGILLIHLGTGDYYDLNEVGTQVWMGVDGSRTIADLAGLIVSRYDVSPEQAQAEVLSLAQELVDEGLLVPV